MTIYADYAQDGSVERIHLGGGTFEPAVIWARELLERADQRFLSVDGHTITLRTTEGVAMYCIIGDGPTPGTVASCLESVEAA